jgi:hypothetical protein
MPLIHVHGGDIDSWLDMSVVDRKALEELSKKHIGVRAGIVRGYDSCDFLAIRHGVVLGGGCLMPDTGFWMLDAGTARRQHRTGYRASSVQNPVSSIEHQVSRIQTWLC